MDIVRLFSLLSVVLALAGCATVSPVAGKFPPITPRQAQTGGHNGTVVRWGGTLIQTETESSQTCFAVLAFPLNSYGRPQPGQESADNGRFLACAPGFYDPQLYAPGREVTVIGAIQGIAEKKVGGFPYHYPRIAATIVHLWPLQRPEPVHQGVYMNGGLGWPGYWWGAPGFWWWGYP